MVESIPIVEPILIVEPIPLEEPNPIRHTIPPISIPIHLNFLGINVIPIPIPKNIGIITPLVITAQREWLKIPPFGVTAERVISAKRLPFGHRKDAEKLPKHHQKFTERANFGLKTAFWPL